MIDQLLVWLVKCYFSMEHMFSHIHRVLKIKFATVKTEKIISGTVSKGHLAVRLNDTKSLNSHDLIELSCHINDYYGVQYLTVITGKAGMEKEFEIKAGESLRLFHNFEMLNDSGSASISVNLIDHDSQSLFLLKLKEAVSVNPQSNISDEDIFKSTLKAFTDFPPIDLYLCMTHEYSFTRLFPLHLSFTHFYCCPVLADQTYSKEAISEGFRKFSLTKQNFGR